MKQKIPNPLFHRRSIRLPGYDYSEAGSYFVTLVTHQREHLFGQVVEEKMILNSFGRIVEEEWMRSASIRKEVKLERDEFVVMPNHFHGIVTIDYPDDEVRAYGTSRFARVCIIRTIRPYPRPSQHFVRLPKPLVHLSVDLRLPSQHGSIFNAKRQVFLYGCGIITSISS